MEYISFSPLLCTGVTAEVFHKKGQFPVAMFKFVSRAEFAIKPAAIFSDLRSMLSIRFAFLESIALRISRSSFVVMVLKENDDFILNGNLKRR